MRCNRTTRPTPSASMIRWNSEPRLRRRGPLRRRGAQLVEIDANSMSAILINLGAVEPPLRGRHAAAVGHRQRHRQRAALHGELDLERTERRPIAANGKQDDRRLRRPAGVALQYAVALGPRSRARMRAGNPRRTSGGLPTARRNRRARETPATTPTHRRAWARRRPERQRGADRQARQPCGAELRACRYGRGVDPATKMAMPHAPWMKSSRLSDRPT